MKDWKIRKCRQSHQHKDVTVNGWFTPNQKKWYEQKASQIYNGTIVEIGVYAGASLLGIVETCIRNNNIVHGIDCWESVKLFHGCSIAPVERKKAQAILKKLRLHLESIIDRYDYGSTIQLHQGFSPQTAAMFEDNSLDLVFIDGDHSYEGVMQDIQGDDSTGGW